MSVRVWKRASSLRPVRISDSSRRTTSMSSPSRPPMRLTPTRSSKLTPMRSSKCPSHERYSRNINVTSYIILCFMVLWAHWRAHKDYFKTPTHTPCLHDTTPNVSASLHHHNATHNPTLTMPNWWQGNLMVNLIVFPLQK